MNNTEILNTLAAMSGKKIQDLKPINEDSICFNECSVTSIQHNEPQDFYCLSVPGKAFFIRDGGNISITGNSLHVEGLTELFREHIKANKSIWNDTLKQQIYSDFEHIIDQEDLFIDLCFEMGGIKGLTPEEVKEYIRYIADRRLIGLGLKGIFKRKHNPIPWSDEILNGVEHSNFFESRPTDYSKGATTGTWNNVWGAFDKLENKTFLKSEEM